MAKAKQLPSVEIMPANLLAFGDDGEAFDRHFNLGKMQAISTLNAVAQVELGRRLIWHKANLQHGEFLQDLEFLPFAPRTAAKYMNVARKIEGANAPARAHLARLGFRKLYELCEELPDAELQKLIETKATDVVGSIDDIDRMSVRELRTALRKERKPKRKLVAAEERVKELEAENAALKGRRDSPTVENAKKRLRTFADRIGEACTELIRIELPDEGDIEAFSRILSAMSAALHQAEMQLQTIQESIIYPHIKSE